MKGLLRRKAVLAGLVICLAAGSWGSGRAEPPAASDQLGIPAVRTVKKAIIRHDGLLFRDADGNGALTPYEDWRLSPENRAGDLLERMTLEEKVGLLVHAMPPTIDGDLRSPWDIKAMASPILGQHIRFFINRVSGDPSKLADMANAAQEVAEASRLGIPLVISSDPRNHVASSFGLSVDAGRFSLWPEPTGFAAIDNPELVRSFGQTVAREFRAVGIQMALSPMADLATEPRWVRISGTFGDNPEIVAKQVGAYVEGIQGGENLQTGGVAAVVKHWVGYGAAPEGFDAHNPYGAKLDFTPGSFDKHVAPFRAAFRSGVSGVMPTYAILPSSVRVAGEPAEPVGAAFSKRLITSLLRDDNGFDGVVLTDFKITDDCESACQNGTMVHGEVGMPWGVEHLEKRERFLLALEAGVDQFGGTADTEVILGLAQAGRLTEARIDVSVRRILTLMFRLGIFENPYADQDAAATIVGNADAQRQAASAQKHSLTLLKNRNRLLPLSLTRFKKVWLWNVSPEVARSAGLEPVEALGAADFSIVRLSTPFTTHSGYFFGSRHHEGSTAFAPANPDLAALRRAQEAGHPVIASVYLDRAAILSNVSPLATALFGDFGIQDRQLLAVIFGDGEPQGKLPFELPSSERAVRAQAPSEPSDSVRPLYRRGFGLRYARKN